MLDLMLVMWKEKWLDKMLDLSMDFLLELSLVTWLEKMKEN